MTRDFTIDVDVDSDHVATVAFHRGRNNYLDEALVSALAGRLEALADSGAARVVVLTGRGKHFCAGADLSRSSTTADSTLDEQGAHLYDAAVRLLRQPLPIVAAIHGAAIGGGLGLALVCDHRVASPEARLSAPFARLGLHHGFGLTVTLPLVVGHQRALDLLYSGRRVTGEEAAEMGLVDELVGEAEAVDGARALAKSIATSAPIAIQSIRATMRGQLAAAVRAATAHERAEQAAHAKTTDVREGIRADLERRSPRFEGR